MSSESLLSATQLQELLSPLHDLLEQNRQTLLIHLNQSLIRLCQKIGAVLQQVPVEQLDPLAKDLNQHFNRHNGFTSRNLGYMRQFYRDYSDIAPWQLLEQIPWGHHLLLMTHLPDPAQREGWLHQIVTQKWDRSTLLQHLKPENDSITATAQPQTYEVLHEPCMLDALGFSRLVFEHALANTLSKKMVQDLLQSQCGFALLGESYVLNLIDTPYVIDILLYHRPLKALVAVEIKANAYQPAFASKMRYTLGLLDSSLRLPDDQPSLGLLVCVDGEQIEVRYALSDSDPDQELPDQLPESLRGHFPNMTQLRHHLTQSLNTFSDETHFT